VNQLKSGSSQQNCAFPVAPFGIYFRYLQCVVFQMRSLPFNPNLHHVGSLILKEELIMKPLRWFHRLSAVGVIFFCSLSGTAHAIVAPLRLDLYDASDNSLMFVTFSYDAQNRNIIRDVYMSDSTFIRRVFIEYDASGNRTREVSYNFNDDTIYVMTYQTPGDPVTGFTLVDEFKLDQIGSPVSYSTADPLNFDLSYKSGASAGTSAAKMGYEQDADGNLVRVNVTDGSGAVQYYGKFINGEVSGVGQQQVSTRGVQPAVVKLRGGSCIDVQFNLRTPGAVRCELMTVSGRRASLLYSGSVKAGESTKRFRIDGSGSIGVASGIYLMVVSVDGVTVSRSRYLHQNVAGGGAR
jgi:hypothetical protein